MNFLSPLFLIGALAGLVPILLHLIKREHARKIEFPTLMFLQRISKKTIRYQKLRHLLLLLMRVLAILLVVFAFMKPYREKAGAAVLAGRVATAHIIVIDNSMSMGYEGRWARAKKAAAGIVRQGSAGDRFAVLGFSDVTAALTQLTPNASDALTRIEDGMVLSDRSTRYAQAMTAAERIALDAGTGRRIIHLISDFQKNGWGAEEQELRLAAGIELKYVDLGSDEFSNLAFRDVHVIEADQNAAGGARIKASIENFGTRDRKRVEVKQTLDGRTVAGQRIDVAKGNSLGVEFPLPEMFPGVHPVVIEVDDPALTQDNRFYLTLETHGKTAVQVVDGPETAARRPPSFFLSKALNIEALSPYRLSMVSPQNLALSAELLIWNDAPAGSAKTQKALQDFVRSGGGLVVALGNSVQPEDFNRGFGSWLPVKMVAASAAGSLMRSRPADTYALMTDVRMDHPIFQPFREPHSGAFSSARFFGHARLSVGAAADVPARFENGDPALVSIGVERGRVLIFASSADDSSNDLPLKAVYAPLWQQMLRYLENFRERRRWLDVGDTVDFRKLLMETSSHGNGRNSDPANEPIVIRDPKKERLATSPGSDSVLLEQAGFYELRSMNQNIPVAVDTVSRESDLTHGNAEEMTSGWISSKPASFTQDESISAEERGRNQHFWAFLLIAAVLFLVSESLFSNHKLLVMNEGKQS